MTRDVKLTHRTLFGYIISRICLLREWLNIPIKYLAMSCLLLTGFLSASNIPQQPCFMKFSKQHREEPLQHSGLVLSPHARANSTGTGNHTTTLPLVGICSYTGQNGPVGKEVAVHSLQRPLHYCPICKSQYQADKAVLTELLPARNRHSRTDTVAATIREIVSNATAQYKVPTPQ